MLLVYALAFYNHALYYFISATRIIEHLDTNTSYSGINYKTSLAKDL